MLKDTLADVLRELIEACDGATEGSMQAAAAAKGKALLERLAIMEKALAEIIPAAAEKLADMYDTLAEGDDPDLRDAADVLDKALDDIAKY